MEHLLPPTDKIAPLKVRYCANSYDGDEFLTFPDRKGWDISTWKSVSTEAKDFDRNGRSSAEIASFLQTWLFFGLLHAVLGEQCSMDDFVNEEDIRQPALNTSILGVYIEQKITPWTDLAPEEKESLGLRFSSYLKRAYAVSAGLTFILYYNDLADEDILAESLFAPKILLETLSGCLRETLGSVVLSQTFYQDLFLERQLLKAGWCPSTVAFMGQNLPMHLQAYAFLIGNSRLCLNHADCSSRVAGGCKLGRMSDDFKPLHVNPGCRCDSISPHMDKIIDVLEEGMIPVLTVTKNADNRESLSVLVDGINLDNYESGDPLKACPFVAFSHVWSDGLGNPHENALPMCQFERLEHMIQTLKQKDTWGKILTSSHETTAYNHGTIAFWLDTLCIPVDPRYQHLRDFSIQKMHDIYAKASGVVVLDPDIQELPKNASPVDFLVRAVCSGWRSRLWTYQESALSNELYLPFQGGCATFSTEEGLLAESGQLSLIERSLLRSAWAKYKELVWDDLAAFCVPDKPGTAFRRMVQASVHRSTSRGGDETICFGTFLGLDVSPLFPLQPEERMPALLALLPVIPPEVLFSNGPRLQKKGFHWAPETFLAPFGLRLQSRLLLPHTYCNEENGSVQLTVPSPYLNFEIPGYAIFLAALAFDPKNSQIDADFTLCTPENRQYEVNLMDTGAASETMVVVEKLGVRFAVLLPDLDYCTQGLLVEVTGEADTGEITCSWTRVVEIYEIESQDDPQLSVAAKENYIDGEWMSFRWWIID